MSNHQFFNLRVKHITPKTEDASTVTFEIPNDLKDTFQYQAGQYLTLRFEINGKEERRAYSMSSSPLEEDITVTVKRVPKGIVSNYIHDQLKANSSVAVMPPNGTFYTPFQPEAKKTYYLFGAGSGITPLMSILKTVLEQEPKSTVFLLYGNRNEQSIIFKEELDLLQQRYEGQLVMEHILSQPKREKSKGLGSLFSKGTLSWTGKVGRIDAKVIKQFLMEQPPRSEQVEYFICGPGDMITTVERALKNQGIDTKHIHVEHFTSNIAEKDKVQTQGTSLVKVHLNGQVVEISINNNATILETLIKEGFDPPYSCTSGACSTCLAKTISGEVKMDVHYAIDDDEVAQGFILTCQAHPITPEVEITYEI